MSTYEGTVCFQDGWHMTVDKDDQPGKKLYQEDDGTYRLAVDGDLSHQERHHRQFLNVELGGE